MPEKTIGEEFAGAVAKEVTGKAVMWGPAIAGLLLLGPVGVFLGILTSAAIVDSMSDGEEGKRPEMR